MSKILPIETIRALRNNHDVSMDVMGVEATLYVPTNLTVLEDDDIYVNPTDFDFDTFSVMVFIEWGPGTQRLRKLSLYTEKDIPIVAWLPNRIQNDDESYTVLETCINSYLKIPVEYIPDEYSDTDEFTIINSLARNFHDAIVNRPWQIAPRRYRADESYNT